MKPVRLMIGTTMRLIVFRFHVSDRKYLPPGMEYRAINNRPEAQDYSASVMLVNRCERSSLIDALKALEENYLLVDAFGAPGPPKKFGSGGHIAQFVLCQKQHDQAPEQFVATRQKIYNGLWAFCNDALWSVRINSSPYLDNGVVVPDTCMATINCIGRMSVFNEDGSPVMIWPRSAAGEPQKYGAKVPLKPEYTFSLQVKTPELVAAG